MNNLIIYLWLAARQSTRINSEFVQVGQIPTYDSQIANGSDPLTLR